ncbi:hypothetical protein [Wolbachia endosymbiont of Ctenocephalides felis wCfeT]|uniref:hypothetical protein n=1 Tax=Wolbachia endosymbiont of Ctenocephalides felis wCfeT TaxID=2732593 RepID=UPI001446ED81|nr:hypothetical protein [Wolbachia endosymbiont of Ctenocephalides felis wCfeT]
MSDDLWSFFMEMPSVGYIIESSHCDNNGNCEHYCGMVKPHDIITGCFYLTSGDGARQKIEARVVDFKPTVCFSVDNQGNKVNLYVNSENCMLTKSGLLHIAEENQYGKFDIIIGKS